MKSDLDEVISKEKSLLDPSVRSQPDLVSALLHPDFREHGASGRVYDFATTVRMLANDPYVEGGASDFSAEHLAPDVILLTYRINGTQSSVRSSVWCREPGGPWRLRFHQGTLSRSEG